MRFNITDHIATRSYNQVIMLLVFGVYLMLAGFSIMATVLLQGHQSFATAIPASIYNLMWLSLPMTVILTYFGIKALGGRTPQSMDRANFLFGVGLTTPLALLCLYLVMNWSELGL